MSSSFLGEFEQMVLLAVVRLGDGAYGVAIRDELATVAGREPSSGALYTTLDRLEKKGLVTSREGESSPDRGGRARRYVRVTTEGLAALQRTRDAFAALWDGVEEVFE